MNKIIDDIIKSKINLKLYDANEAETRKKLIDRVLECVLGWSQDDISYEERVSEDGNTTFADYIIKTADVSLLVEAKRIGKTFQTVPNKRKVKISGTLVKQKVTDLFLNSL